MHTDRAAMNNPLLEDSYFPAFGAIEASHIEPAIDQILSENRQALALLLQAPPDDWSLVVQLDELEDRLNRAWSPVSHMNAVVNSPALRDAYNACLPKLTEYATELGQNEALCAAYQALADQASFADLSTAQQKVITDALRDFRLSGIDLGPEDKRRYGELKRRLSELSSRFSENVLDATQDWSLLLSDPAALAGLPDSALAAARQLAKAKDLDGYLLTLDFPSFHAVMTYADDGALRETVYRAFITRASDQNDQDPAWDNAPLIEEILALKLKLAKLLGFDHYAQYSLATKMATTPDQVLAFLEQLNSRSQSRARQDFADLQQFASQARSEAESAAAALQPWDVGYYSEKQRQSCFAISQEQLRPYFPAPQVLKGLFAVVERLFGIQLEAQDEADLWHADARLFRVARQGQTLGYVYLDLYARSGKRGGAWMDVCRTRRRQADGSLQLPVAYLVCNFNAPIGDQPALLTHNEVTTLFHECGHGLHHLLTEQEWSGVSGINGVPWDAVELPSQFLENWCWEPEALALISGHVDSGAPLPEDLLQRMLAARNFQSAMMMVRQLEFALFDFRLHCQDPAPDSAGVQSLLDQVRREVAVMPPLASNRFQNSFSHIFSGGYAAGYYSYKWAEVLSADAYSRFEEEGVFNAGTGQAFYRHILSQGGSREPMELFVAFRGREPQVDALLRHCGIVNDEMKGAVS